MKGIIAIKEVDDRLSGKCAALFDLYNIIQLVQQTRRWSHLKSSHPVNRGTHPIALRIYSRVSDQISVEPICT